MYVIFPADEVVYLSYGRLIYVPLSRSSTGHVTGTTNVGPARTSQSTGSSQTSCPSVPSTSTSSTKSRHSTASAPIFNGFKEENKRTNKAASVGSLDQPSTSNSKPDPHPARPKRNKNKKALKLQVEPQKESFLSFHSKKDNRAQERKLSYSDFLSVNRERSPHHSLRHLEGSSRENRDNSPNFDLTPKSENNLSVPGSIRTPSPYSIRSAKSFQSKTPPEKSSFANRKRFFGSVRRKRQLNSPEQKMAGNESPLKDLTHPSYNESLKQHNNVTFKLVKTVSDFTQQLGQMYEQHAEELQMLVSSFRKKNGELRKERPACPSSLFHTWETLLQEVEIDSQALGDIASILGRQVSRPLLERSFHRKIQSRKVFTHREGYDTIIAKTEEKLVKCRQEYKNAYLSYLSAPTTESLSAYFNSHNAYVQQLHATNGMLEEYGKETLPQLLQELEEIYTDLCSTLSEAVLQGAEVVSTRAMEQCRRYEGLVSQCRAVSGPADLAHLARSLPAPQGRGLVMKRPFVPPQPPPPPDPVDGEAPDVMNNDNIPPPLKDELVIDRLSAVQVKPSHDALKKEAADLEAQIRQIQDALDTLLRIQQRSVEAALYNKANELQEDISMKRFDLRVAQIHLSAINAQKELFSNKLEGETGRERKMSSASTGSTKNKWLKAFKSLKTPPLDTSEKKNGSAATRELLKGDPDAHNFQEYTYKKITPCDVCSQILRGHTRQGLKCRICKMNVHVDCQEKAPKCTAKARLLRRQKSTSEIETRVPETTVEEESFDDFDKFSGMMPTINRQLSIRENRLQLPSAIERNSQDASGTRPFGQPLCLGPQFENGNGLTPSSTPPSPSPSKGKISAPHRKGAKSKK